MERNFQKIYISLYKRYVYIFWCIDCDDKKFLIKKINEKANDEDMEGLLEVVDYVFEEEDYKKRAGFCSIGYLPYGNVVIFVYKGESHVDLIDRMSTLTHEVLHATFFILDKSGVKYLTEDSTHEAFCYLQSHLYKEALISCLGKR